MVSAEAVNFTLYPIYWLADDVSGEPFDLGRLPFDITEDVRIESVRERFRPDTFDPHKVRLGTLVVEESFALNVERSCRFFIARNAVNIILSQEVRECSTSSIKSFKSFRAL